VSLGGTGLVRQDEASTDPDSRGAEHESSSNRVTVEQTTGSDDLHGLACQRALLALDQLGNSGDEDGGWDIASVTTTLTTLSTDDIDADVQALGDVLGVTDHVHAQDTGTVELLDNGLGRNTDGRDEQASLLGDDDIDELAELTLGVVVAVQTHVVSLISTTKDRDRAIGGIFLLGLAGTAADLGKEEVDTEGGVLVGQIALELGDLFAKHVRGVANATDHTETTGVGDSGRQLGARCHVHASQQNGVVDLEKISDRGTDLLCSVNMLASVNLTRYSGDIGGKEITCEMCSRKLWAGSR
jgi:hypothetical protein